MHANIPVFIPHMGCPFNCIFCDQKKISSQHQVPGREETVAIIEQHLASIPPDAYIEIAFFGGNFTSLPLSLQEEYLKTTRPYLDSGRVQAVRLSTRPDCIDLNILEILSSYGVKTVELGVQSLHEDVLKRSGRGYHVNQVLSACHLIRQKGLQLGIQLMVGLPGDSREATEKTVEQVININPDMVRIYPTLVIEGTALETMYREGLYTPLQLEQAVDIAAFMYSRFQRHRINVIRMGLQPSEDLLQPGTVVAGPFHPAFGELVKQKLYRQQAEAAIKMHRKQYGLVKKLVLLVNYREVSKLIGHKKANLKYLAQAFNLESLSVKPVQGNERGFIGVTAEGRDKPEIQLTGADFLGILEADYYE